MVDDVDVDGWIHIYAGDTVLHSWEVLASILSTDDTLGILCDIGMYVHFPPPFFVITRFASNATTRSTLLHLFVCLSHNVRNAQAGDTQERDLQLPRDRPQPQDPAHSPKDVARE